MTAMMMERTRLDTDELELLALIARGLSLDVVARRLNVSERTVRRRVRSVCGRVGVDSSIEAVVWAVRRGLL